jgi:hypothetical protein
MAEASSYRKIYEKRGSIYMNPLPSIEADYLFSLAFQVFIIWGLFDFSQQK